MTSGRFYPALLTATHPSQTASMLKPQRSKSMSQQRSAHSATYAKPGQDRWRADRATSTMKTRKTGYTCKTRKTEYRLNLGFFIRSFSVKFTGFSFARHQKTMFHNIAYSVVWIPWLFRVFLCISWYSVVYHNSIVTLTSGQVT